MERMMFPNIIDHWCFIRSIIERMKSEETARKAHEDEAIENPSPIIPTEEKDKKKSAK